MLSIADCIALSGLTEAEIEAIAEHEHLPMMVAAEYGAYLLRQPDGAQGISRMIVDDLAQANARGDIPRALALKLVLRQFLKEHGAPG